MLQDPPELYKSPWEKSAETDTLLLQGGDFGGIRDNAPVVSSLTL